MKYLALLAVSGLAVWGITTLPSEFNSNKGPQESEENESAVTSGYGEAMKWRALRWQSEDGTIKPRGKELAMEQRLATLKASATNPTLTANSPNWVAVGPTNIMGRSRALIVDPSNTNKMFVGNVAGGVWKSTDRGTTWTPCSDQWKSMSIASLAFDPQNSNVIYAGTGEEAMTLGFDFLRGVGIYRSVDGGTSWKQLTSTNGWLTTNGIAVHPTNSNTIFAAVYGGNGGIHRSTDGGASWTKVLNVARAHQVFYHPTDPTKMLAAAGGGSSQTVYYSTNSGATWTACAGLPGNGNRIRIAQCKGTPNVVYAHAVGGSGTLYKSTDGGVNFSVVSTTLGTNPGYWYNLMWVSPTDPNLLCTAGAGIKRSINGGTSWTTPGNGYINTTQPHPDFHQVIEDPGYNGTTNKRVYVTTDGGVYGTDDITTASTTAGWYRLDRNCQSTHFYGIAGNATSGKIYGGTQDNGDLLFTETNGTSKWLYGGDGGFAAMDPTNDMYTYNEYVNLRIHRSTNNNNSSDIISGLTDAGSAANFIAPFVLDHNNPNRMLGGGASLWRSDNVKAATPTWSAIKGSTGSYIAAIAIAPGNSDLVYVGHNNGAIFKSTNATAATPTWTAVAGVPARYVNRIVIDPTNNNNVWVALGGYNADCLWRSTNGGTTWTQRVGTAPYNLPAAPAYGVAVHPNNSNRLYVGTEVGVYSSADGGATWTTSEEGPANVCVEEVVFMHNSTSKLLIGTYGRGAFTAEVPNPAAFVSGTVTLEGQLAAAVAGTKVTLDLRTPGTTTVIKTVALTLDAAGAYYLDPQVQTGTYDLAFKGSHWLRKIVPNVTLGTSVNNVATVSLTNGDVNNDNRVNLSDFSALSSAYGSNPSSANWNVGADLNGDNVVNLSDFSILSTNYGRTGQP